MREIKIIKERQKDIIYSGYYKRAVGGFGPVPSEIPMTYKFPDIDYGDATRSGWQPALHCFKIEAELIKGGREMLASCEVWRDKILGALRYWVRADMLCPNWWYNQVGVPNSIANIALLTEEYLDNELSLGIEKILRRGSFKTHLMLGETCIGEPGDSRFIKPADTWTGANLIWGGAITIKHALWTEDAELLKIAARRISEEIKYDVEGIQKDSAFCQHGPRWYSGGYGRSFVYELSPIISILSATSFAIAFDKVSMVLSHILDGQRHMQRNGYFDFGAIGREYVRPGAVSMSLGLPLSILAKTDGIQRRDEIGEFYLTAKDRRDNFEATKYFDSICLLSHKKNGVYFGIRGRKDGILGAEKCNDEGVLSYNMTYGTVTCIMESGKEYFNISPLWDYSAVPGTTARWESDDDLLGHGNWENKISSPCTTRGASDNGRGILTENVMHDGISLTATYFTFGGSLVALGAGIKGEGEIYTTVDQCRADSPEISGTRVKNGRVIYETLDGAAFKAKSEIRRATWNRNNLAYAKTEEEGEILTVKLPRSDNGTYAYVVTVENSHGVEVLRNDESCQAIRINGKNVMAVFHRECKIALGSECISGAEGEFFFG